MTTENPDNLISQRPYLIRAIHEWCSDNGLTPYLVVSVNEMVRVPREHVKDDQIVLNISWDATNALQLGNDFIEFKARFGGALRDIVIPVRRVAAIFAKENGQGIPFPPEEGDDALTPPTRKENGAAEQPPDAPKVSRPEEDDKPPSSPDGTRRSGLRRVK